MVAYLNDSCVIHNYTQRIVTKYSHSHQVHVHKVAILYVLEIVLRGVVFNCSIAQCLLY